MGYMNDTPKNTGNLVRSQAVPVRTVKPASYGVATVQNNTKDTGRVKVSIDETYKSKRRTNVKLPANY